MHQTQNDTKIGEKSESDDLTNFKSSQTKNPHSPSGAMFSSPSRPMSAMVPL